MATSESFRAELMGAAMGGGGPSTGLPVTLRISSTSRMRNSMASMPLKRRASTPTSSCRFLKMSALGIFSIPLQRPSCGRELGLWKRMTTQNITPSV